jgi:hypothetical protein
MEDCQVSDNNDKVEVGDDSVVMGRHNAKRVGDRSVVVGPTDDKGNVILNQPMAIGHNAQAGPGSIAIGSNASAGDHGGGPHVGSVNIQGPFALPNAQEVIIGVKKSGNSPPVPGGPEKRRD